MADQTNTTKLVSTRIKNKYDTYANWTKTTNTGILLKGEVAVVAVPTGNNYINPVTNVAEPEIELLMKVGDGTKSFKDLPWLSAKASDVYNWAKTSTAEAVSVKAVITPADAAAGTEEVSDTRTLANWAKQIITNAEDITNLRTAVTGGVHYRGQAYEGDVDSATSGVQKQTLTNNATIWLADTSATGGKKQITANSGDIVIYGDKEYIWDGSNWQELGDLTRVGTLETLVGSLSDVSVSYGSTVSTDPFVSSRKFATHISNNSGVYSLNKDLITAVDIKYSSTQTLDSYLDDLDSSYMRIDSSTAYTDDNPAPLYFGSSTKTVIFDCGGAFS